jgi:serine/threonine protein kinase
LPGKHLYIVLPYCSTGDLGKLLLEETRLPEAQALPILKQIVAGMQYLHENQISHRDLKPDNIFIENGVCKIADFGFSSR